MAFLTLSEAIRRHVRNGAPVALEGFTHPIPIAPGHEIMRQGRRNLTFTHAPLARTARHVGEP